jgi:hypothetical protein
MSGASTLVTGEVVTDRKATLPVRLIPNQVPPARTSTPERTLPSGRLHSSRISKE